MSKPVQPAPILPQSGAIGGSTTVEPTSSPVLTSNPVERDALPTADLDAFLLRGLALGCTTEELSDLVTRGHLKMARASEFNPNNEPPDDSPLWDDPAFLVKAYLRAKRAGRQVGPGRSPDFGWLEGTRQRRDRMKNVVIAVAGTNGKREYKDVSIMPGTKSRDVLTKLDLTGFQLSKPDGGAFAFNDDLYPAVADGQKLFATASNVEAGLVIA